MKRSLGATLLFLSALSTAEAESYRGDYTVSYLGLPIAQSSFTSTMTGDTFRVEGKLSSSGIGAIFDSTEGTIVASGRFVDDATRPDRFEMRYQSGKKAKRTVIGFSNGRVTSTKNVPPLKKNKNPESWVLLGEDDLKGVVDPLSGTLLRAKSPEDVCRRTIKVFDGEMRADLVLKPAETELSGQEGAVTCNVSFRPISGYRKAKKALVYLRDKSEIVVAFAPVGSSDVYAPVYASIDTRIGPVTVRASKVEAVD